MKKAFKIKEVKPGIFLFEFSNHYDMCMHFLRYQEYYESPSPKFRGKAFDIFEFMKWYSNKYGKGAFTYPIDWSGFNIPGDTIKKVWDLGIHHKTIYDFEMLMAWSHCNTEANGKKFYIIGTVKGNDALQHEIAHGLFYLHPEYKKGMVKLVKSLDASSRKKINIGLKKLGYTPKVYIDETQAYLATGVSESFGNLTDWAKIRKPFERFFKEFLKKEAK